MSENPNLIERLNEIAEASDRALAQFYYDGETKATFDNPTKVLSELSHIDGIVGEILTMIDGR